MYAHLDLFTGVGGFALAAHWTGFETIAFCENEEFPNRILAARFPGRVIHRDIRELDGRQYRGISLITGGFPCQPFSVAGNQKGKEDDRWLWKEMLRVIAQAKPSFVIAENVTGLISMALDEVLHDLETEEYSCTTLVIPACSVNAPHRRDRVWIIGKLNGNPYGHNESDGPEHDEVSKLQNVGNTNHGLSASAELQNQAICARGDTAAKTSSGWHAADTDTTGLQRYWRKHGLSENKIKREIGRECRRSTEPGLGMQDDGFSRSMAGYRWPEDWEQGISRTTDGGKDRVNKLKALGNAIVPQVAEILMAGIMEDLSGALKTAR